MRALLQLKVLVPLVVGLGLLMGVLGLGNTAAVVGLIRSFDGSYMLGILLVLVGYEVARAVQWHFLLARLGGRSPLHARTFSFLLGEVAKAAPAGNYLPSYILTRVSNEPLGRACAASSLIIVTELAVSVAGVLVLGVDGWVWLRPTVAVGVVVAVAGGWLLLHPDRAPRLPRALSRWGLARRLATEAERFREGLADLLQPGVIVTEAVFSAAYLLAAGGILYLLARGLGVGELSPGQAFAAYFLSRAFSLVAPLPSDFGKPEVSGVGALLAMGVDRDAAVGIMLANRLVSIGAALAVGLVTLLFLRGLARRGSWAPTGAVSPRAGGRLS